MTAERQCLIGLLTFFQSSQFLSSYFLLKTIIFKKRNFYYEMAFLFYLTVSHSAYVYRFHFIPVIFFRLDTQLISLSELLAVMHYLLPCSIMLDIQIAFIKNVDKILNKCLACHVNLWLYGYCDFTGWITNFYFLNVVFLNKI